MQTFVRSTGKTCHRSLHHAAWLAGQTHRCCRLAWNQEAAMWLGLFSWETADERLCLLQARSCTCQPLPYAWAPVTRPRRYPVLALGTSQRTLLCRFVVCPGPPSDRCCAREGRWCCPFRGVVPRRTQCTPILSLVPPRDLQLATFKTGKHEPIRWAFPSKADALQMILITCRPTCGVDETQTHVASARARGIAVSQMAIMYSGCWDVRFRFSCSEAWPKPAEGESHAAGRSGFEPTPHDHTRVECRIVRGGQDEPALA